VKREVVTIHQHQDEDGEVPSDLLASSGRYSNRSRQASETRWCSRKTDGSGFYPLEIQRAFAVALKLSEANAALSVDSIRHTLGSWPADRRTS
jgi:hypothetical protein